MSCAFEISREKTKLTSANDCPRREHKDTKQPTREEVQDGLDVAKPQLPQSNPKSATQTCLCTVFLVLRG